MTDTIVQIPVEFQYQHKRLQIAYRGPVTRSYVVSNATTGLSTQGTTFSFTSPGQDSIMLKNPAFYWYCRSTFTGTPSGNVGPYSMISRTGGDCPRFYAVSRNFAACSVALDDGTVTTQQSGEYLDAIMRYESTIQERNSNMSTFPSYQDPMGPGWSIRATEPFTYEAFVGTNKDPTVIGDQGRDKRGDFPFYVIPETLPTTAPAQQQEVRFLSVEPLGGQPIFSQANTSNAPGFGRINAITIIINFAQQLVWWSKDIKKKPGVTSVSNDWYAIPQIVTEWWTPAVAQKPTVPLVYPYSNITCYTQNTTALVNPGATQTITCNSLTVNNVPSGIIFFARPTKGQQISNRVGENSGTIYAMDNYAGVQSVPFNSTTGPTYNKGSVNISFDNVSGQLSTASPENLYNTMVRNGLVNTSKSDWMEGGGIYFLKFGSDIYLSENKVAGSIGTFTLQVSFVIQNNYNQPLTFDGYLLVIQEGHFIIGPDGNKSELVMIKPTELNPQIMAEPASQVGNGLFGTLTKPLSWIPWLTPYHGLIQGAARFGDQLLGTEYKGDGLVRTGGAMYVPEKKRRLEFAPKERGGYAVRGGRTFY